MKYPRILAALRGARWAVTPCTLEAIYSSLGSHLRGDLRADDLIPDPPGPASSGAQAPEDPAPGVAVLEIYGIIGKNLSLFEAICGGVDVNSVQMALEQAVADPSIRAIVLDFDSPGGVVTGVPELAKMIAAADDVKPVYAFTGGQCCSAAYWLASQARAVFSTISADVGSIGVYVALCDDSEWWKNEGYKLELMKAGQFKYAGGPGQPLAADARELIQAGVDEVYRMFTADVQAGRGRPIDPSVMQGQTFMGAAGVTAGLTDELVDSLDDLLIELSEKHSLNALSG